MSRPFFFTLHRRAEKQLQVIVVSLGSGLRAPSSSKFSGRRWKSTPR